jgi:acetoacetyl-CoA synthetase
MWNWQVSALASGATLVLFDGSPLVNKGEILLDLAQKERLTLFGTSAKYISAIHKNGMEPMKTHTFPHLRTIASTGSPLSEESFDYIYDSFKSDVQLVSMSGGTDLVGCFVLGNSIGPVYKGEIQAPGLGMNIEVFDIQDGKGELVCTKPFMSQPLKFWNDDNNMRLLGTYFQKYPNIWHHGDYIERTVHGGFIIHGRSDTTLKPGGVRIGTAEIYRQVEKIEEVLESAVIGQNFEDDVRIILFVKLKENISLSDDLKSKIKLMIKENTTNRHVPAKIIAVPDIPKTKSGKITEIAIHDIIHGKKINNVESLANPESLDFYTHLVIE